VQLVLHQQEQHQEKLYQLVLVEELQMVEHHQQELQGLEPHQLAYLLVLVFQQEAKAASPLECGMKQMGVRGHIECTVTQGRVVVREVHLNNGECRTMQEHFERNPQEFDRLKSMIGYPVASLDYRHSYRQGQTFTVYIMPCRLHDFMIETDLGTWGWLAQR
jgi:hypothetical protein